MTESAPTAKNYRAYTVRLRQIAKDMEGRENRSFADNHTARKMQKAFGDHLPESRGARGVALNSPPLATDNSI